MSDLPVVFVVTCEHARPDVPRELDDLGLSRAVLQSHRSFDVGALPVATVLARALRVPLHAGRWSRLVADLNRSDDHARVVARRIDGSPVPGNTGLSAAARKARLDRYWRPHRAEVLAAVTAAVRRGLAVHLAVHSFVERLNGIERKNDVGLLFDPARDRERALVDRLHASLSAQQLRVRRNFPYFGDTDALTTSLRGRFPVGRYLGIEIELNQRLSRTAVGQRGLAQALVEAVRASAAPVGTRG